jgi:hypothetical protein
VELIVKIPTYAQYRMACRSDAFMIAIDGKILKELGYVYGGASRTCRPTVFQQEINPSPAKRVW